VSRQPRANEFLFDVDRFENDPTVLAMSPLARAFYARLLPRLWKLPEVGVVPDSDAILGHLCEAGEHWTSIRSDIRSAFDSTSRPGYLIQHGMARTHAEQTARIEEHRARGRNGGLASARRRNIRNGNAVSGGQGQLEASLRPAQPVRVRVRVRENTESSRAREGDEKSPPRDMTCDSCGRPIFPFDRCPHCTAPAPPPEALDDFISGLAVDENLSPVNDDRSHNSEER
jgi:hypothetical protein